MSKQNFTKENIKRVALNRTFMVLPFRNLALTAVLCNAFFCAIDKTKFQQWTQKNKDL